MTFRFGTALCVLGTLAASCSGLTTVTAADDGARVSVEAGEEIEVRLDGNATTGFSWDLVEYDPTVIAPSGDPSYVEDDTDLVGAGGTWVFTLIAQAPGETDVRFEYARVFEDQPASATFAFTAIVDS
jgi:predicted secreted protein